MEIQEEKREKSRNLRIFEFFKILQLEALCAELRSKIYTKTSDRNFWKKVYEFKKKTVQDIAERNKVGDQPLPSIFTDEDMYRDYCKEIYGTGGFPTFLYKNKENEYLQAPYDSEYYYAKGSDVSCKHLDQILIGQVEFHQPSSNQVTVKVKDEVMTFPITDVTRIL